MTSRTMEPTRPTVWAVAGSCAARVVSSTACPAPVSAVAGPMPAPAPATSAVSSRAVPVAVSQPKNAEPPAGAPDGRDRQPGSRAGCQYCCPLVSPAPAVLHEHISQARPGARGRVAPWRRCVLAGNPAATAIAR
jgi:hypothetical protein